MRGAGSVVPQSFSRMFEEKVLLGQEDDYVVE
jgi:hypothetical protein